MNKTEQNQESTTSQPPNPNGSPVTRDVAKPIVRLYDMGNHIYLAPEGCPEEPLFNALGAVVAVATAAEAKANDKSIGRAVVIVISPHETQHRLHEAMIADLQLDVSTSSLQKLYRRPSEIVVLDLITQTWAVRTEDDWRLFSRDPGFLKAAFSAARREMILLAHRFELLHGLPASAALRRQIDALQQAGIAFEPFPETQFQPAAELDSPGIGFYLDWDEAYHQIQNDVAAAKARVIWNLPGVVGGDRSLIQPRPGLEQVLIQELDWAAMHRWEELGFKVSTELRGELCIVLDDDLVWLIGTPRDEEAVRPFARVRGRRTACLLAKLYKLSEFFKPTKAQ